MRVVARISSASLDMDNDPQRVQEPKSPRGSTTGHSLGHRRAAQGAENDEHHLQVQPSSQDSVKD